MKLFLSFILLCFVFLPYRLYHLTYPLADSFNFRQTQTATFARNMYKHGINLFRTELDIFGMGRERYLTLEFPLYEAMATMLYRLFYPHELWGRVVSILAGYIGAWFLMQWVILVTANRTIALWSAFFFLAAPLSLFYHRAFMIEPTLIACLLVGLYYSCRWILFPRWYFYVPAVLFLTVGFMQKGLYGPFWLFPIAIFYWSGHKRGPFWQARTVFFLGLLLVPLFFLIFWQRHINQLNTANGQLFFTTSDAGHLEWNFGLLADRLSWPMWKIRLTQILNGVLLKPGLLILFVGLVSLRKLKRWSVLFFFWLSAILYVIVVFRIQAQNYYQLILVPSFAPIMAAGVYALFRFLRLIGSNAAAAGILGLVGGMMLWKSWDNTLPSYSIDWAWLERIQAIGTVTEENDAGIFAVAGNEWNSIYTYYSGRTMKRVEVENVSPEAITGWKSEGYAFIVLYAPEQYPAYLSEVKPGHSLEFLSSYPLLLENQQFRIYRL